MDDEIVRRKPLLCRIGLHRASIDSAFFTRAYLCYRCGDYMDSEAGKKLQLERELCAESSELGLPFSPYGMQYVRVYLRNLEDEDVPPRPTRQQA